MGEPGEAGEPGEPGPEGPPGPSLRAFDANGKNLGLLAEIKTGGQDGYEQFRVWDDQRGLTY